MIFEKLAALIAEQLGVDKNGLTPDTNFRDDLGVDSLDIVELSMALEDEFGIGEMSEEDLASITTLGDLVAYLQRQRDMGRTKRHGPAHAGPVLWTQRDRGGART